MVLFRSLKNVVFFAAGGVLFTALFSGTAVAQSSCSVTGELQKLEVDPDISGRGHTHEYQLFALGKIVPIEYANEDLLLGRASVHGSIGKNKAGKLVLKLRRKSDIKKSSAGDSSNCSLAKFTAPSGTSSVSSGGTTAAATSAVYPSGYAYLHSRPTAKAKLFLDFDGATYASWGGYTNVVVPPYDTDGNPSSFSTQELSQIHEVWERVSETYSMMNVDVTNEDPGNLTDKATAAISIGGSCYDWYGASAGGVAYVGGFSNGSPNVGFAFAAQLGGGNPKYCADAAAHEAGHLFGLQHQSTWSGTTLVESYNSGVNGRAPVMGVAYYVSRSGQWWKGPTPSGPTSIQDDLSIVTGSSNGFGYTVDDFSSARSSAAPLPVDSAGNISTYGVIEQLTDSDYFTFLTAGGAVSIQATVYPLGPALDVGVELLDGNGVLVASSNSGNLSETLNVTLASGRYYLRVFSAGGTTNYLNGLGADLGQYVLSGSIPPADQTSCLRSAPVVTYNLTSQSGTIGSSLSYTASITDTDTSSCPATNFTLGFSEATGQLSDTMSSSSVTLAPGGTSSVTVAVSSGTAGSYTFAVQASDNAVANHSGLGNASATFSAPDVSPPTAPGNLRNAGSSTSIRGKKATATINLAWSASTDDRTPQGSITYRLYRVFNGATTLVTSTTALGFKDSLSKQGAYQYYAVAVDQAGNASVASNVLAFSY